MNKTMITEQQIELLNEAYKSTLGTENYLKYKCEWYFKNKNGVWKFSIWGMPFPYSKGYFKTIRGETYIYNINGTERVKLNSACKELLNIA